MMKPLICASVIAVSCAFQAQAGQTDEPRQALVRYDDVNIRESAGAQILLGRIEAATRSVCGPTPDQRQLGAWVTYRTCMAAARDRAVASLPFDLMAQIASQNETVAVR
ncbi:MAG TPA: UrcA family protein [Rhizomicrobium sp.]|nr:UrcA family protein [Rhizomicrobium sp.]